MNTTAVTSVEIDAMSAKRLNQFVLESGISDLPEFFIELKPADKKQAVKKVLFDEGEMPKFKPAKGEIKPKATKAKKKTKVMNTEAEAEAIEAAETNPDFVPLKVGEGVTGAVAEVAGEVLPPQVGKPSWALNLSGLPDISSLDITTEGAAAELALDLLSIGDYATYHLGGIFCRMADQKWFMGHKTFRECCDVEFGVQYRKAAYFMQIYRAINDKGIDWQDVISVGWTKLKELTAVMTKDNAKEWAETAKGMSTVALIEHVKMVGGSPGDVPIHVKNPTFNKTFKLHEDQKDVVEAAIIDAKEKSGTEVDTVALELICTQYLGDPIVIPDTEKAGFNAAHVVADFFEAMAGTSVGLKMLINMMDKHYSDVNVDLQVPDTYDLS